MTAACLMVYPEKSHHLINVLRKRYNCLLLSCKRARRLYNKGTKQCSQVKQEAVAKHFKRIFVVRYRIVDSQIFNLQLSSLDMSSSSSISLPFVLLDPATRSRGLEEFSQTREGLSRYRMFSLYFGVAKFMACEGQTN